jgi:hypothetical protein
MLEIIYLSHNYFTRNARHLNIFFFSEFGFKLMCHNSMRSIILESVPQTHRIVIYQFGTKF